MKVLTFRIDENYCGYSELSGLVSTFTREQPGQFATIEAVIPIQGTDLKLPVPEEVYSQLYAPTDADAPHPIRGFRPIEEIRGKEKAWRAELKKTLEDLAATC